MKSFKQYITEKRDKLMVMSPYAVNNGDEDAILIDGLINPSKAELEGFIRRTELKGARFILNKDRLLVWDAGDAIHADVLEGEFRIDGGALHKMSKNRDFAYGIFDVDSGTLAARLNDPEKWVPALLRKNPRTKHLFTSDADIIATDDSGMPV